MVKNSVKGQVTMTIDKHAVIYSKQNSGLEGDVITVQPTVNVSTPVTTEPKSSNVAIPLPPPSPKATAAVRLLL